MTTPNLARIERVDLREAWVHEAYNFTPWLAKNISELGVALGMNLEFQEREAAVGGFSLDILATDLDQNRTVIIENQLEDTNHSHLGQLLTYAAGYDASVIVWLTGDFRDEHRAALDWLNQRTGDDTEFFGVVVELFKIGNSPCAPHFKVVATPNEWRKSRVRSKQDPLSPRDELSRDFRLSLSEKMKSGGISIRAFKSQSPARYIVIEHPLSLSRAWYAAIWNGGKPGLELYVDKRGDEGPQWNQKVFEALEIDRRGIEVALTEPTLSEWFAWEPTAGNKRHARVAIYRDGDVFQDKESWGEFQDWMIQKLHKFRQVITPRLKEFSQQEQPTIE